jgi:hypothetical protein
MPNSLTLELDTHEAWMLSRAAELSESERLHLLERLGRKLPATVANPTESSRPVRDRKLTLETAMDELWSSAGVLDGELWREIHTPEAVYPGHRVSSFGRVVSLPVERSIELHGRRIKRVYPGRLLSPTAASSGRERVCLRKDGHQKMHYIDLLVWWTFRDHATDEVFHVNGDPADCRLSNLKAG